jgi:hypothetical protein
MCCAPYQKKVAPIRCVFSIIPLQLATNIAIAETSDDLERYYGFDKLPSQSPSVVPPSAASCSYALPPDVAARRSSEILQLDVAEEGSRFMIPDPPPNSRRTVLFNDPGTVSPI